MVGEGALRELVALGNAVEHLGLTVPSCDASRRHRHVEVEHHHEVRHPDAAHVESGEPVEVAPGGALVGEHARGVAVAHHVPAGSEGGKDDAGEVLAAVGGEEERGSLGGGLPHEGGGAAEPGRGLGGE